MRVVGIGTSAGGLGALKSLFASVPDEPGICFVVVMHLSPEYESHLASLLQPHCRLPVQQLSRTTPLEPDHVYVIPPGANLDAIDTHLRLSDLERQRQERAPIDHFFRTLAEAQRERAVGVVLTGTGSDGTAGLQRIRERGGLTIVQSPDEAEYDAMPRSAIDAGVADLVLRLDEIPARILQVERATSPLEVGEDGVASVEPAEPAEDTIQEILTLVHRHSGHDFRHYKRSTILRRIHRRMQLHRLRQLGEYLDLLRTQDGEVGLLFEDLLIKVTEFFRDPRVFEHLQAQVVPGLFEGKGPDDCVRAWSVGTATGEEAYSLAMLLLEEEARRAVKPKQVQIFATDLHGPSLRKARAGVYPASIEADVSTSRLDRFFLAENGRYRVRTAVRERIVFALHNILQDPPFSRLQLITCRNLLIYLRRDAQRHLVSLFHYALDEGGYLLVGTAEGVESDLFVCEDKQHGLYRRRSVPTPGFRPSTYPLTPSRQGMDDRPAPRSEPASGYGAVHEQVVELYAPPSVLIDPAGELVHCSARAGRFLRMSGGTPSSSIFRLLPEPLKLELRAAIHAARERDGGYRSRPVALALEGQQRRVILRVQAVDQPQLAGFFLVIFDELDAAADLAPADGGDLADATTRELETELEQTKRRMQTLIEDHESDQERSQAYSEELESTNEELRSAMEELETSREEMQSMNEELITLNEENLQKVEELDQLSSDLHHLLTATDIATVFVDRQLRILRFTPRMGVLLGLSDGDRGRPLTDLVHRLGYDQLPRDCQHVLDQLAPVEREVFSQEGRWYMTRLQCYRNSDDRIDGMVITFIDITERKEAEQRIREAKDLAENIIDTVRNPMLVLDSELRVRSGNEAFHRDFGLQPSDVAGRLVFDLGDGQWDVPALHQLLEDVLPESKTMDDFQLQHEFEPGNPRSLILNARQIDHVQLILLAIEDVTERERARRILERSHDELEDRVVHRTAELQRNSTRLQILVRELTMVEQRERKRMASILHDEVQQLLVAAKMHLRGIRNQGEAGARSLESTVHNLDQAIDVTRTLVRQVAPQILYEEGLIAALRWLADEMARRYGLHVRIAAEPMQLAPSDEIGTVLFESIREMLFNVVKHAEVREATVAARQEGGHLRVTVSDEGIGFDAGVDAEAWHGGRSDFGVFSWKSRIEALGGRCSIHAAPGAGTRVEVEVLLDPGAADVRG